MLTISLKQVLESGWERLSQSYVMFNGKGKHITPSIAPIDEKKITTYTTNIQNSHFFTKKTTQKAANNQ